MRDRGSAKGLSHSPSSQGIGDTHNQSTKQTNAPRGLAEGLLLRAAGVDAIVCFVRGHEERIDSQDRGHEGRRCPEVETGIQEFKAECRVRNTMALNDSSQLRSRFSPCLRREAVCRRAGYPEASRIDRACAAGVSRRLPRSRAKSRQRRSIPRPSRADHSIPKCCSFSRPRRLRLPPPPGDRTR